jgi:predicted RNase H-like HicB family nuclease
MITYRAMYKFVDGGVHAEVLDFPGAISCGADLEEARRMLRSALVDMAETALVRWESLPAPNPSVSDPDSDLEEPIHSDYTARRICRQLGISDP